ncbi:MAG: zf-HC2 domain-containing protein [Bryobacteraceae bacterium]
MSVIPFSAGSCEKVRRQLDSYVSGELLVETNHEVLRHLESCRACQAMHDERMSVRNHVRRAVRGEVAPVDLAARVRSRIERDGRSPFSSSGWAMVAVAAAVMMTVGVLSVREWRSSGRALSEMSGSEQASFIEAAFGRVAHFARGGLGDHLHCAMGRKYPSGFPAPGAVKGRQRLNEDWSPLQTIAARFIPSRYTLLLAHRCTAQNRRFVHFTYVEPSRRMLSVVVARRTDAEHFDVPGIVPGLVQAGIPIYSERSGVYSVAAFEGGEYMAWVVSDLPAEENRMVAGNLAPSMREFLSTGRSEI